MGKSRLMKEISRSVPSVYICFRPRESSGYPKPTPRLPAWVNQGVMDQVLGYTPDSDTNFTIPTFKFAVFLLALLQQLAILVDDILSNHTDRLNQTNPYLWMWEIFAEPGSQDDEERGEKFWEGVISRAENMMNSHKTRNAGLFASAYSYLQRDFGPQVCEAYANVKQALHISFEKDFNLLLICDEARILCDISAVDGKPIPAEFDFESAESSPLKQTRFFPFSNFRAFRRALKYLKLAKSRADKPSSSDHGKGVPSKKRKIDTASHSKSTIKAHVPRIFALLIDTSSRLTNFQPASWEDRSLRAPSLPPLGHVQFEPIFTFTSIDAHSMYRNERCSADVDLVANSARLLEFGRAGWYSVGIHLDTDPVSLAMVKLVGGREKWSTFFETPPDVRISAKTRLVLLAILAPRLALTVGPRVREAAEIIASHLAILMRTDTDRHFLRSAYPSEPVVAEASAQMTGEKGWGQVLKALYQNVQTGIVEGGFRGELLSKVLCLIAVDQSQPDRVLETWQFTRPVKVSDFLNNFIKPPGEPGKFATVTESIKAFAKVHHMDQLLIDRFLNGHVFFNHFIRVEEDLTLPMLIQGWNRAAALSCKACVEAIDHVIPVMLAPESNWSPKFGPLYGEWNETEIEEARRYLAIICINSNNFAQPRNHNKAASQMTANEKNIKFSLSKDGKKSMLVCNILQEFGPKQPRVDNHNVILLDPAAPDIPQELTFILKDISSATYECLESLEETSDGRLASLYLEKLRVAKADYDGDLVAQKRMNWLAARHDNLPLVFGATSKSSIKCWNEFRERIRDN